MTHARPIAGLALLIAGGCLLGLTGCATSLSGDTHWKDFASMRDSDEGVQVPSLVASDARDIDLRVSQQSKDGTQLRWKSDDGITRKDCEAGPIEGTSRAGASWWPEKVPDQGWSCGWWRVFEKDDVYYAWHNAATR